jgi:hypothetical protein
MKQSANADAEAAWEEASKALEEACQMPWGPQRMEALKRAGRLRYEASKQILATEQKQGTKTKGD